MQIYIKDLFNKEISNLDESIKNNTEILIRELIDKVKNDEEIEAKKVEAYVWLDEKYRLQKKRLISYLKNNGNYYKID